MSGDAYLGVRSEYGQRTLELADLSPDPIDQLRGWLEEANRSGIVEPTALCLATATADGRPSGRMVLLRGIDPRGLTVFTNYESRKAGELDVNPHAAMTFWWGELERQVRVEGRIEKVSAEESDAYFASRPYESQIASAASPQSRPMDTRQELEDRMQALRDAYPDAVPRPENWGGYRLIPETIEFWQGRAARTHDRFVYHKSGNSWLIERLAP